jgi:hypothetical protein
VKRRGEEGKERRRIRGSRRGKGYEEEGRKGDEMRREDTRKEEKRMGEVEKRRRGEGK